MAKLPPRFSLNELQERIVAANASPVGFVGLLAEKYGQSTELSRDEFFDQALHASTGYATAVAGTADTVADKLEEIFEGTGSRGGFMISLSQAAPRRMLENMVDRLVPELQRRGRYRRTYTGKTLRENLAE
jgi:alkanesulfonate monooxygenase SsuD/methylene tetrahydromethanopterin reductase-like flavin-dependent oxidoreductase (luciferase family)